MQAPATELVVFDFDGTLYRSPSPPPGHLTWPFQVYSLDGWGLPGFDRRWNLNAISAGRQANNSGAMVAILTARPDYAAMRSRIEEMAAATGLAWSAIQLRPVYYVGSHAAFKADIVSRWLDHMPSIRTVTLWEDSPENLEAVHRAIVGKNRRFVPRLIDLG